MEMKLMLSDADKYIGSIGGPRELPPGVAISPPNTKILSGIDHPNKITTGDAAQGTMGDTSNNYQFGKGG